MDLDPDNYTMGEILTIFAVGETMSMSDAVDKADDIISQNEHTTDATTIQFLKKLKRKMETDWEQTMNDDDDDDDDDDANAWLQNELLPATGDNDATNRVQQIDVFDNTHLPMKRKQLDVKNTTTVPFVQDSLNPTLKNTLKRIVNIDSQFRQADGGNESTSSDFTLDLSSPLLNVLNMKLRSIQLPYTWYNIDYAYGNTCMWITNHQQAFKINIKPGNYTPDQFVQAIQHGFKAQFGTIEQPQWSTFTYSTDEGIKEPMIAAYNTNTGILSFYLDGWTDPAGKPLVVIDTFQPVDLLYDSYFTFFDSTTNKSCYNQGSGDCTANSQGHTFSGTLGWLMGFRWPLQPIYSATITYDTSNATYSYTGGNQAPSVVNLATARYIIVCIDDFNQNHLNNGLVTITETSKSLPIPSYFRSAHPQSCTVSSTRSLMTNEQLNDILNTQGLTADAAIALGINPQNLGNALADKMSYAGSGKTLSISPSAPRTLTAAQLYTANEIMKNRNRISTFRAKPPSPNDVFAIIPLKGLKETGDVYVDFSGAMQDNARHYFGPVNIERMRIRLIDDKGHTLDLHGAEWSINILCESLYQY